MREPVNVMPLGIVSVSTASNASELLTPVCVTVKVKVIVSPASPVAGFVFFVTLSVGSTILMFGATTGPSKPPSYVIRTELARVTLRVLPAAFSTTTG